MLRRLAVHSVSDAPLLCVASTAAGVLAVAADGTVARATLDACTTLGTVAREGRWRHAAVDPSGTLVALADAGEEVTLARPEGHVHRTFVGTSNGFIALAFVDAGATLICADHKEVFARSVSTLLAGGDEARRDFASAIYSLSDHATSASMLVGAIGGVATVFRDATPSASPYLGNFAVLAVADAGPERAIFGGDRAYDDDLVEMVRQVSDEDRGSLVLVDLATPTIGSSTTTSGTVLALRCTPDRRHAVVGCLEGAVLVVDATSLEVRASATLPGDDALVDLESPNGDAHRSWSPTGGIAFDGTGTLWIGTGGGKLVAYAMAPDVN